MALELLGPARILHMDALLLLLLLGRRSWLSNLFPSIT
jgi:hypothetical protein